MRLVILESPYAGDVDLNVAYARKALRHSLVDMGESPIASHLLYTQVLDDSVPIQREMGITAGLAWRSAKAPMMMPSATEGYDIFTMPVLPAFYIDLGWSSGMERARTLYQKGRIPYETRRILDRGAYHVEKWSP